MGKIEGIEKRYNESGELISSVTYKDDKVVSGVCGNGRELTSKEVADWNKWPENPCNE